MTEKKKKIHQG
jgi:hypothetical protein